MTRRGMGQRERKMEGESKKGREREGKYVREGDM